MGPVPENLLESDRIEDVLEDSGPPAPVVVVQNRNRVLPWLLIVGAIAVLALGSALAYHRREVARLRLQAELARRDLQRAIEQAQAEENELRLAALPPPPVSEPTGVSPMPPAPVAAPTAEEPKATPPAAKPEAPSQVAAAHVRARVLTQLTGPPVPAPASDPLPPESSQPAGAKPAGAAAGEPTPVRSPFDEPDEADAPARAAARVDVAADPASVANAAPSKPDGRPPADPAPPPALPAEPPLPSRGETERQILAEAAEIQRDSDQKRDQQREELQALRDDERKQFLDELRMILSVYGRNAGPEIERLSNRSGRTQDPALLMRARIVISETRASQRAKVHRLRDLGVPESVILDYLANGLNKSLGARNGPRSRNEVWVRAGLLLLNYHEAEAPAARARVTTPTAGPGGRRAVGVNPGTR